MAANCSSPIKIALVNGVPEVVSESDSDDFIFQGEDRDSDIGDEMALDLTALGQQHRFTYPSLGVPCPSQRRMITGD